MSAPKDTIKGGETRSTAVRAISGYVCYATSHFKNLKHADDRSILFDTLFPISADELVSFLRVKQKTNAYKTLLWYIKGLHYHPKHGREWLNAMLSNEKITDILETSKQNPPQRSTVRQLSTRVIKRARARSPEEIRNAMLQIRDKVFQSKRAPGVTRPTVKDEKDIYSKISQVVRGKSGKGFMVSSALEPKPVDNGKIRQLNVNLLANMSQIIMMERPRTFGSGQGWKECAAVIMEENKRAN